MKVLGITVGVGSWKSEVLNYLREAYGAVVCQMDETAKRLQEKGTGCFRKIAEAFGPEIIGADGELDRKKLGARVFSDPEQLRLLNSIVHPEVLRSVSADIRKHTEEGHRSMLSRRPCSRMWAGNSAMRSGTSTLRKRCAGSG